MERRGRDLNFPKNYFFSSFVLNSKLKNVPVFVFLLLFPFPDTKRNKNIRERSFLSPLEESARAFFIMLAITLNEERKETKKGEDEDPFSPVLLSPSTTGMVGGSEVTVCVRLRFSRCSLRRPGEYSLDATIANRREKKKRRKRRLEKKKGAVFCFEMLTKKTPRLQKTKTKTKTRE